MLSTIEHLDDIATRLYKMEAPSEVYAGVFTLEELDRLWTEKCVITPENTWGAGYDDEVYDARAIVRDANREELEQQALNTISADLLYELADSISSTSDWELRQLIACRGDYSKEQALLEGSKQ